RINVRLVASVRSTRAVAKLTRRLDLLLPLLLDTREFRPEYRTNLGGVSAEDVVVEVGTRRQVFLAQPCPEVHYLASVRRGVINRRVGTTEKARKETHLVPRLHFILPPLSTSFSATDARTILVYARIAKHFNLAILTPQNFHISHLVVVPPHQLIGSSVALHTTSHCSTNGVQGTWNPTNTGDNKFDAATLLFKDMSID